MNSHFQKEFRMSLPKKIAALATSIAGVALLLAVQASAQTTKASTSPKAEVNYSGPTAEAPKKKVVAHRHLWSKKHTPKTASGTPQPRKAKVAHQPTK
jgi:hypothetical protein